MYNLAAALINWSTSARLSLAWKNPCINGTLPRAPWIVARGKQERKQNITSGASDALFNRILSSMSCIENVLDFEFLDPGEPPVSGLSCLARSGSAMHGRHLRVMLSAQTTPVIRHSRPTPKTGTTSTMRVKTFSRVRVPSMLKSTTWPKTQTPPKMFSILCSSSSWTRSEKTLAVTMTMSSGWNNDPLLKRIGTTSAPPSPAPKPYAISPAEINTKKASTACPENTGRPQHLRSALLVRPYAATRPIREPASSVARILTMLATATTSMFTSRAASGCDMPLKMPNKVSA
mmetsp:Transcript_2140/g.5427  ORF Transcript_2140/g.5427 Transcript_2140/m.5427 type:complete len:290 (+) Transcript_2140:516-1385(+)